jgi:hypothetical protein
MGLRDHPFYPAIRGMRGGRFLNNHGIISSGRRRRHATAADSI